MISKPWYQAKKFKLLHLLLPSGPVTKQAYVRTLLGLFLFRRATQFAAFALMWICTATTASPTLSSRTSTAVSSLLSLWSDPCCDAVEISPTVSIVAAYPAIDCHSDSYKSLAGLMWALVGLFLVGGAFVLARTTVSRNRTERVQGL